MKHFLTMLMAAVLIMGVMPISVFAIEEDDKRFNRFLSEIGWEKQAYLEYLESKDWPLEEVEYMDELGTPITEETVQTLLKDFDIAREELNKLLEEYGYIEKGQDVLDSDYLLFIEEIEAFIDKDPSFTEIIPENLQELVDYYEFGSVEELEAFLNGFGDSYKNYQSIEELEGAISLYLWLSEDGDIMLDGLFSAFGLTEEELDNLGGHLGTLDYENSAFKSKLTELAQRMMAIGEFETADELTAEQIAEILSIFNELQSLFKVTTQYYLITEGEKQAISLDTLLTLDTTNGFDLLIEIYNQQGTFLADILLTADLFDSDVIVDTGEDLKEIEEVVSEAPAKTPAKPKIHEDAKKPVVSSTVKGGKLPKTAGGYAANTLAGLALVLIGIVLFRRFKVAGM
ncbi:processed acidic surface protein [Planomicrobium sp. CPCC 101079]|uniref:processed acidic surface protein n=1 Tax=Planomicrobium sp. CPCC 101079 TaxID=2599618 RepID=UPI0011B54DF8|nr:processed acidic surface protein [Planomicrobium sp. CPCC 101079]TWT03734.1 processed acidic surface protein [Planomicrobium sp. CPCC 101079]